MAFVSVSTTSFLGSSVQRTNATTSRSRTAVPTPVMKWDSGEIMDKMLAKYQKMSETGPFGEIAKAITYSKPSSIWQTYTKTIADNISPLRREMYTKYSNYAEMMAFLTQSSKYFATPGNGPIPTAADEYMADCAARQYKMTACPNGVYNVSCTEGTTKGQAEDQRTLSLGYSFRARQLDPVSQYGAMFEKRRLAIVQCNMCNYEEKLCVKYPASAAACITGYSEARALCYRSSDPNGKAERYMANCIDAQYKMKAVTGGLYGVMCQDGAQKGLPEFKRVQALSARFRAGQKSKLQKEQNRYDAAQFARASYAHLCSYEEKLFNRFPAVSAAMRPESSRY